MNKAESTLSNMLRDPEMTWLQQNIGRARGGADRARNREGRLHLRRLGRSRVLVAKEGGKWHGPSFYTMATGERRLQAGVSVSENRRRW